MIEVKNCVKTFYPGSVNEVKSLRSVNLFIPEGEFVVVVGTNGSGKSTLLNAIAGTFSIDEGEINIGGENVTHHADFKRAKCISRVFQNPLLGTASSMTVAENMQLAQLRGVPKSLRIGLTKSQKEFYKEELKKVGMHLEDKIDSPMQTLSGGQRQAITLLMASLNKPKLLLLDEHTAALDPLASEKIMELSNTIIRENKLTAMMVTHSMPIALQFGDSLIMMDKGEIIWRVSKEEKKELTSHKILDKFHELNIHMLV